MNKNGLLKVEKTPANNNYNLMTCLSFKINYNLMKF